MKIQIYAAIHIALIWIPILFKFEISIAAHIALLATFFILAYNEIMPKRTNPFEKRIKDLEVKVQNMSTVDSFRGARR